MMQSEELEKLRRNDPETADMQSENTSVCESSSEFEQDMKDRNVWNNKLELEKLRGKDPETGDIESEDTSTSGSSSEFDQDIKDRGVWSSKLQFFLAIVGYTVGIGDLWRFPIICSRNGGGAFLIPFFFFLITAGGPLYYLEVCLGQFTGMSAGLSFKFCPLLEGIGLLQVLLSLFVVWYLITILAWVFYFLYSSFFTVLPWSTCDNPWNTANCRATTIDEIWTNTTNSSSANSSLVNTLSASLSNVGNATTLLYSNITNATASPALQDALKKGNASSAFEFWEYKVIGRSAGLEEMGGIQLHLVICLFLAWTFCVLALIKGVKTLGKVVYVTATAPYIFLTIMFVRGLTLDGAADGLIMYLTPDFSKLLTVQVWLEAAVQVFYSLGPAWGGVITMASYNKFHQKSFWASTVCVASCGFTSFFNGLVVFSIIGFMAHESGMSVQEVAKQSGPGLTFVAFPTALSRMPFPQLWSVLFFLMLVTVVFDTLFGMMETVTCGIIDSFPKQLTSHRVYVNMAAGLVLFITGLPLTMNGGIYIFQLADWYFSTFALLFGSVAECIAICWIYGTDRFSKDISMMAGRDVSVLLRCMWSIVVPIFVAATFIALLAGYSAPAYGDGYVYSSQAIAVGITVGMLPIGGMMMVAIRSIVTSKGSLLQRIRHRIVPSPSWAPNDFAAKQTYASKPYESPVTWKQRVFANVRGGADNPLL